MIERWTPVCTIRPGRLERGRDVGRAAEHALGSPTTAATLVDAVDAVLQRQHDGVGTDQRRRASAAPSRCRTPSPRRSTTSTGPIARGVAFGRALHDEIAELGALHLEPCSRIASRCAPRAMNVTSCPALREFRAEITAHRARTQRIANRIRIDC